MEPHTFSTQADSDTRPNFGIPGIALGLWIVVFAPALVQHRCCRRVVTVLAVE